MTHRRRRRSLIEPRTKPLPAPGLNALQCAFLSIEQGHETTLQSRRRELSEARQALAESEYKLSQIVRAVPSMLWVTGPGGEVTKVNQRALDYTGTRLEDFLHLGWNKLIHPDDRSETINAFSHAIQSGTSYEAVHRLRRADGEYRWHHSLGEPLRDRQGRIIQWYGLSIDIDESKKAEDRLRRSEAWLSQAQRLSHTGNWVYNPTTMLYVYWSDESYRIWGFDPLQGLPSRDAMWQRIHPDDRDRVWATVQEAVRQNRDFTADGPPQRIWDKGQAHLPGDEAWLIGEQRTSGEKKYYLANLPAATDLRTLAATLRQDGSVSRRISS